METFSCKFPFFPISGIDVLTFFSFRFLSLGNFLLFILKNEIHEVDAGHTSS